MTEHPASHPFLLRLAGRLLVKAERSVGAGPVRLKLDHREAPELYGLTDAEQMQRWILLLEDWCRAGWVSLLLAEPREFASFVDRNPRLELRDFDALAAWAGYEPQSMRWQRQWLAYLATRWENSPLALPDRSALLDYLARNPFMALQELPMEEAARSLEALQALCATQRAMPLREASARVFQGRSKLLDSREEMLRLLGAAPGQFQEAPIQLLLDIPESFDEVLFVENLVTFERMADLRQESWRGSLLVYAAGFKGSAKRLRSRHGCRLYVRAMPSVESAMAEPMSSARLHAVEDWLFGDANLPVRFFGDLDYSGMQILASLREVFGDAEAWSVGYGFLAEVIEQGGGHAPVLATKEQQVDPVVTGCGYADQRLLPLIRQHGRFVDQEVFQPWFQGN